jgi:hypothetical protein
MKIVLLYSGNDCPLASDPLLNRARIENDTA